LWLGVAVLVVLLGSCGLGFAISRGGESAVLRGLRDVGVIFLLIFYVVQAVIWAGIYFALAWVIGYFGPRLPAGLNWVGVKAATVDGATTKGAERFVIRPLAGVVGKVTASRTFLSRSVGGVSDGASAVRRWSRELTDWPTLQHRLRGVASDRTSAGMSMPVGAHGDSAKVGSIVESGRVGAERR